MGITTITAGRILKGQLKGNNGEEEITNMESMDNVALSKTYGIDSQTTDSAATATAYLTGVKTRVGMIGLSGQAKIRECSPELENYKVKSILKWAKEAGKSVGIVTTTRITHATPAGTYAHTSYRNFETFDGKIFNLTSQLNGCKDIAAQLIDDNSYIDVIFGGGRRKFLRKEDRDYHEWNKTGERVDNRNLINDWHEKMERMNKTHKFVWNISDFKNLKPNQYDHVLGILAWDHMKYEIDRVAQEYIDEPSISEMTEKAIELLSTNPNGFFLLVEGKYLFIRGRIDLAHHDSNAKRALEEFVALDEAIGLANKIVDPEDTLVVVTADHSHEFNIGGYSKRGNPILGLVRSVEYGELSSDGYTFTSLSYGNGPGGLKEIRKRNLTEKETFGIDYHQESAVFMEYETHGGEDVAIFAKGPMSHLFDGTVEQSFIAYAMAYASCIGPFDRNFYPLCEFERGT
ncbi:alkaline phosphatase-like [Brachionus plicatilis]|uniref:alkaline phosphatase n=1 Tax=Brachionus plicatilis TaxID=10195 RepID=A0A3M7PJD7_BRAPC|nr:alkaline phosphatase-like [Brachionus plicatilis]